MYSVSAAYKTAIKQPIIQSRLSFEISGTTYDEEHVLSGSFEIANQCTDTSDVTLGSVYIGEMTATFLNIDIARTQWRGTAVEPYFELKLGDGTWERVPLGIFTVTEAIYTRWGVEVKAYDDMRLFDRNFSLNQSAGYLYDFLVIAAETCHVTLAQTEEQIKALPNGRQYFSYYSDNDVETWRDLISWIAQTCGGYATIDRAGRLEIRTYGSVAVDSISPTERHEGGSFSDYVTKYTGLAYTDIGAQTTVYASAEIDDGTTINLGANPFLQNKSQATTAVANLLTEIAKIRYTPFKVSTISNPAYDLGDVITFTGGLAGNSSTCCLMKFEMGFHKRYSMSGYGANPDAASARSKVDKNIAGLLAGSDAKTMAFYELRNVSEVNIGNQIDRQLLRLKIATNAATRAQIHMNINLGTESLETDGETIATVTYLIDGEEATLHPEETYIDGMHVMHLMYVLPMSAGVTTYFIVRMKASGGKITIDRQGIWLFASGLGLVGDGTWDGTFDLEDEVMAFDITEEMSFYGNVNDTVVIRLQTPVGISASENVEEFNVAEIEFASNIQERLRMVTHSTAFDRVLEDETGLGDVDSRVLEDEDGTATADARVTEEEI